MRIRARASTSNASTCSGERDDPFSSGGTFFNREVPLLLDRSSVKYSI
jgi:hypothetical protein